MALDLSAVVTAAEWKDRNGEDSSDEDTLIGTLLTSVTRVVERRCEVAPGMFLPQTALTYTFTATGGNLLYLRDERGWMHPLRSVTADSLLIDSESDATFDGYTLDLSDGWVRGYPVNAATESQPYTAIQLLPGVSGAAPTAWTDGWEVRITGNWGYAACPGAIKERVIGITRELLDVHRGGAALDFNSIEDQVNRIPSARMLLYMLEREFSHRIPHF